MINLTRQQWRDLAKRVGKDWSLLKKTVNEVEEDAFKKGVDVGIDSTKNAVLNVVHTTLHEDFGFGPKRMGQFNDAFRGHLNDVHNSTVEPKASNVQQLMLSESDKERVMVLIAMSQFIESVLDAPSIFSKDGELKDYMQGANIEIANVISTIRSSISESVMTEIIKELENTCLYIAPKNI